MRGRPSLLHGAFRLAGTALVDGEAGVYLMFAVGERPVCGIDDQSAAAGEPARWATYFSVADVDATVAANAAAAGAPDRAQRRAGGGPHRRLPGPAGRALVPFPQRARAALPDPERWEPGDFIWEELLSPAAEDAAEFYADRLGYGVETMDMAPWASIGCSSGGTAVAGIMPMPPDARDRRSGCPT